MDNMEDGDVGELIEMILFFCQREGGVVYGGNWCMRWATVPLSLFNKRFVQLSTGKGVKRGM